MKFRLYVLAAALLFSTGGAAIKAISLTSWQVAALRSLVAAVALLLLLPESRRGWSRSVWLAAVAYALTLVLFVHSTKLTTGASAIYLQATAPFYLLFIGPLLLREPNRWQDLLLGGVISIGMVLFFFDASGALTSNTAPNPVLGNVLGAASGLSWALTVTGLRKLSKAGGSALAVISTGNLLAFAMAAPLAFPIGEMQGNDLGIVLYLGCFQIGLAYFLLTKGVQRVPAFEAATLMLLEPAMNPVWTYLVHGERPGPLAVAGGAIILVSTLAHTAFLPGYNRQISSSRS